MTVPPATASSSPTGPSASYTNISPEQLADLLSKVGQNHGPAPRLLSKPRIGGKGPAGVWTGFGAGCKGIDPKSATCMRDFDTSVVKSFTAMAPIEDKCQSRLRDCPDLLFSMPTESNANMTVNSLIAFEERMTHHGLEGIFHVVSPSGKTLNMFREPGMCTSDLIRTWCEDVITNGVHDFSDASNPTRHGICDYDRINMIWSGEALLNSCTEALKQDLKFNIQPDERYGPEVLMTLLTKLYRPSQSKIESLRDKLKSLDIRKYPGENVTTFVQDASKLVREIRMNFTNNSNVPDLTTTALSGLTLSSDDFLLAQVRTLRINSDVNGFGGILGSFQAKDPIAALQTIDDLYRVLISQSDYGPARQIDIKHKALQAKVEDKLVQDRNSSSSNGSKSCWDCGDKGVIRGHDGCTKRLVNTGVGNPRKSKHGLDDATNLKVIEAIKNKTLPDRGSIQDSAKLDIIIDGKTLAKYCRHCGRFTKGASQHYTSEHTGTRSLFAYTGTPSTSPSPEEERPGTASAMMAVILPATTDSSDDVEVIDSDQFIQRHDVNYGFGLVARTDRASIPAPFSFHDYESDDSDVFLDALVKDFGGQED